jgi:hypothetical protein
MIHSLHGLMAAMSVAAHVRQMHRASKACEASLGSRLLPLSLLPVFLKCQGIDGYLYLFIDGSTLPWK